MEQSNVFDFDGFQIERESSLGSDCYGVVTSCKKDGAGIPYHWRWSLIRALEMNHYEPFF